MPLFKYEALDSQGVAIKNEVEALSQKEAVSKIRNMGYFPTKVSPASGRAKREPQPLRRPLAKPKKRRGAGGRVKVKFITQFARQLSTLQDAGLPILRSLRILEEQQKAGTFKRVIGYVADDIEGGATLSEAMSRFPQVLRPADGRYGRGRRDGRRARPDFVPRRRLYGKIPEAESPRQRRDDLPDSRAYRGVRHRAYGADDICYSEVRERA